jgi:hypothetical protein
MTTNLLIDHLDDLRRRWRDIATRMTSTPSGLHPLRVLRLSLPKRPL